MTSTKTGLKALITLGLSLSLAKTALAEAGYGDAITARTQKNTGVTGQWYELKTSDWLFFEGEAAAQYNLGAISAGTKVEVLKMNKQMARVRLPDGRVVFVRNRLLEPTAAPSTSEKQSLAARTSSIGRERLHGGSPYAKPTSADLAVRDARPGAEVERAPVVTSGTLSSNLTRGISLPGGTVAVYARPAAVLTTGSLSTQVRGDDSAAIPLPRQDGEPVVSAGTLATAPAGTVAVAVPPVKADEAAVPANVPVPQPRPKDLGQTTSGSCDPKKQWQSPVHQTFRITDCLGSSRDGGGRRHAGVDIAGASAGMQGIPIFPTADGTVIRAGHNGGYGCFVEIKHKNCPDTITKWRRDGGCITRYAHMQTKTYKDRKGKTRRTCDVPQEGAKVTPCTRIGGMSGTGSRGRANDYASHLHFELRDDSTSIAFNPNTLLSDLRKSPHFKSAGSASCKGTNNIHGAQVYSLNAGRIETVSDVRAEEGRD